MYCEWNYHPHNLNRVEATLVPNFLVFQIVHVLGHAQLAYLSSYYSGYPYT